MTLAKYYRNIVKRKEKALEMAILLERLQQIQDEYLDLTGEVSEIEQAIKNNKIEALLNNEEKRFYELRKRGCYLKEIANEMRLSLDQVKK